MMKLFALCAVLLLHLDPVISLVAEDRIAALSQTTHSGWKTPWVEMSISEMPRFMKNDIVTVPPNMPRESENSPAFIWNSDEDITISYTFSDSRIVLPSLNLYNSKDKAYIERLTLVFEHDGYELIRVTRKARYKALTELLPPTFELEYKWKATRPDDVLLGVQTMFILSIVVLIGMCSVVCVVYDRDTVRGRKHPAIVDTFLTGGSSGIHVRKRTHSK